MKIYTKKGDEGQTSLIGGTRVSKAHLRIDAYGTVDELNSCLGMLRDMIARQDYQEKIAGIQDRLFTIGSHLAADPESSRMKLPEITDADVFFLEKEMDEMDQKLPEMKHFILPGGHTTVSWCHVTRCVCRRAERLTVLLHENQPVEALILKYLNRLSDYLFVLARMLSHELKAGETPWIPK